MLRILLAVIALLIYGSLYPWRFHHSPQGDPVTALLHSWDVSPNRFFFRDVAINIAIYVPFGAAAYLWLRSCKIAVRIGGPVLLAGVLSTAIELAQFYDAKRFTSLVDVAMNVTGSALGVLLAIPVAQRQRSAAAIRIQHPGALFLFACWAGSLLFPLIPDLSRTHLSFKLAGFFATAFSPVAFFALFAAWLLAARLLSALVGEGAEHVVFPVLGLILPLRVFIADVNASWEYWASFFLAWLVWAAVFTRLRNVNFALAQLAVASAVLTGLAPFHFTRMPQPFEWVPFRALFSTQWETGFTVFLRKVFLYGSAIWLFREGGFRLRWATAGIAVGLAAIEAVQRYLPSHAAESTDPLLAILIAWLLHRLARAVGHSTYETAYRPDGNFGSGTGVQ